MKTRTTHPLGAALALVTLLAFVAIKPAARSTEADEATLKFNFRGVPIETVLDYLSEAAGFIIVLETEVSGEINAWSSQPITSNEAVDLLDTLLADKGYAAVRNGRILKIVAQNAARKYTLPVKKGSNPSEIPSTDQMVTQIIPVRYADATQLIEDLQPLLPDEATLTANQSSNALVLTDRQASIHRIAEIITALDTSISSISTIRVFPLEYADAAELADVVKEIFEQPASSSQSRSSSLIREAMSRRFGFGGDRGSSRGDSRGSSSLGSSEARQAASHVVAVADERTNSLVVSAPDEFMPTIEEIVNQIDRNVDDITEIAVFHLEHADATETAQIIKNLFEDQDDEDQPSFRFGRSDGRRRGGNNQDSQRLQQQTTVIAVADPRTNSVIVSASSGLMSQISQMINQLDNDNSRKQKVYVYSLEHADADNVAEILRGMFEDRLNGTARSISRQNNQQNNPLNNRTVNAQPIRGAAAQ
ncbi:MAG: putative type II secretion system protein D [Verrucomicrobia subdivision 3 bacterium]|nr:putative type II secretion system protein D [Limisphaerales bacterium]MCS1412501.1 putative type II secretion system protein D [Limisphaerales bacterium]